MSCSTMISGNCFHPLGLSRLAARLEPFVAIGAVLLVCLAGAALIETLLPLVGAKILMPDNLLGGLDPASLELFVRRPFA